MGDVALLGVTDEDVILEAPMDFAVLCPRDQRLAWGVDGVFASEDRWRLQSASVDFEGQGLTAGSVVQLLGPSAYFKPPGEALVVESVSGNTVELRRKGQGAGVGQPPGPVEGLTGVEFVVTTLGPQIARAAGDVERRLGLGAGELSEEDREAVRGVVALVVLSRQYMAMSRDGVGGREGPAGKAEFLRARLDERLARLVVEVGDGSRSVSRLSTRIGR
jgi:hypothetical protein